MSKPPQVTVKPASTMPQKPLTLNEKLAKAMAGKEPTHATPKSESFHVVQEKTAIILQPSLNTTQFKYGLVVRLREAMTGQQKQGESTAKKIEFRRLPLKPATVIKMPAMEIKGTIKPQGKR